MVDSAQGAGPSKEVLMIAKRLLSHILTDEALTRGLADPEARMLVEWLVDRAEGLSAAGCAEDGVPEPVGQLCRRARAISRFVGLWCHGGARGAALQLACAERFTWPLPTAAVDPCELMESILTWESRAA
jgi:hypothetical protein